MLDDGSPINLDLDKVSSSDGYHGYECAAVVAKMLGAEATDLGFPQNFVIIEENSLLEILNYCKSKGILKNYQFISGSGVDNSIKISDRLNDLLNIENLLRCHPFYSQKYFFIVDNYQTLSTNIKNKLDRLKNKLGSRFIELTYSSLEDYYKLFNEGLYMEYEAEKKDINNNHFQSIGTLKAKYSKLICKLINNQKDFSLLFNNELDLLITENV